MVKLRDLVEDNKKEDQEILSNTPTKMTKDIKEKVFNNKVVIEPED